MHTKSILLKTWEVRGILDGWLTQLVRPVTPQPEEIPAAFFGAHVWEDPPSIGWVAAGYHESGDVLMRKTTCPFGKPGDVLWVQEDFYISGYPPFAAGLNYAGSERWECITLPDLTGSPDEIFLEEGKLQKAETMPRGFSRLSIMNVETKVERIKGINYDQNREDHYDFCRYMRDCALLAGEHAKEWVEKMIERDVDPDRWNLDYPETPWERNPWCFVATIRKV